MTNIARTITPTEALAVPSTDLPSCRFADPDAAWRSDAWETLRDMAATGETALQACGSELLFASARLKPSTVTPAAESDDQAEDTAYGYTFAGWLAAAGRNDSASQYDLRAAWRAGESPEEYRV